MNRPAHWALSPLDLQAHLLLDQGCHPKGVLKARCGHLLPPRVMRFAEVSARKCTQSEGRRHLGPPIGGGKNYRHVILDYRFVIPRVSFPRHRLPPHRSCATLPSLTTLRTEVTQRSGKRDTKEGAHRDYLPPTTEVIIIDAMASVDTVVWRCCLCDHHGTATTRPTANSNGIEHLTPAPRHDRHRSRIAPPADGLSQNPRVQCVLPAAGRPQPSSRLYLAP